MNAFYRIFRALWPFVRDLKGGFKFSREMFTGLVKALLGIAVFAGFFEPAAMDRADEIVVQIWSTGENISGLLVFLSGLYDSFRRHRIAEAQARGQPG